MMPTRRVQLVSTKPEREAEIQSKIAKVKDNGSDSTIAAQAVEQFPSTFRHTNRTEKRRDDSGTQEMIFFLLSKLCGTYHCRLVAPVKEDAQFGEHKLRRFMGDYVSVITGRIFFMKF